MASRFTALSFGSGEELPTLIVAPPGFFSGLFCCKSALNLPQVNIIAAPIQNIVYKSLRMLNNVYDTNAIKKCNVKIKTIPLDFGVEL